MPVQWPLQLKLKKKGELKTTWRMCTKFEFEFEYILENIEGL